MALYNRIILQFKAAYYSVLRKTGVITLTDNFGVKMRLHPYDTIPTKKLLTRENYKYEYSMYDRYAKGVVIDAGANIGVHSVYLSRLAEKVYAFEPVPRTFKLLEETIVLNKRTNIVPVNSALGSDVGTIEMHIFSDEKSVWDSIHVPDIPADIEGGKPVETQDVSITTLDVFAEQNNLGKIGFIKIDVEGHELAVLQGARKLLSESRIDILSFEVAEWLTKDATPIFDLLASYGYKTTEPYVPSPHDKNYYALSPKVSRA